MNRHLKFWQSTILAGFLMANFTFAAWATEGGPAFDPKFNPDAQEAVVPRHRMTTRRDSPLPRHRTRISRGSHPIQGRARDRELVRAQARENSRNQNRNSPQPQSALSVRQSRPSRFRKIIIRKDILFLSPCVMPAYRLPSFIGTA